MCRSKIHVSKPRSKPRFVDLASANDIQNQVKVRVASHAISALVDTGADISIMSNKLYQKAKLHKNSSLQSSKTFVRGVTGTHLNVIGQVTIPIEIDNVELHQSLHVTENCSLDLILGVDFLKAQHSQIDFN